MNVKYRAIIGLMCLLCRILYLKAVVIGKSCSVFPAIAYICIFCVLMFIGKVN
jgi:hypothetical protein